MGTLGILETHTQFERFLESHTSDEVVGSAAHKSDCPIARFLRGNGFPKAEVANWVVFSEGADPQLSMFTIEGRYPLPPWAMNFISSVDKGYQPWTGVAAVTASAALRLLKEAVTMAEYAATSPPLISGVGTWGFPQIVGCQCPLCTQAPLSIPTMSKASPDFLDSPFNFKYQFKYQAPMPQAQVNFDQVISFLEMSPIEEKELVPA